MTVSRLVRACCAEGTPQPVIDKLHKAMADVLAKETVKQRLERVGAVVNL